MPSSLAPFLRAKIHGLTLSAVEARFDLAFAGGLVIGPRLAWAAGLVEFDRVDVTDLVRCETRSVHVLFGTDGRVELWQPGELKILAGDAVRVSAYAFADPATVADRTATFVLANRQNQPVEIRQVKARGAPLDPATFPLPPREEKRDRLEVTAAVS